MVRCSIARDGMSGQPAAGASGREAAWSAPCCVQLPGNGEATVTGGLNWYLVAVLPFQFPQPCPLVAGHRAATTAIAHKCGTTAETLRTWSRAAEADGRDGRPLRGILAPALQDQAHRFGASNIPRAVHGGSRGETCTPGLITYE